MAAVKLAALAALCAGAVATSPAAERPRITYSSSTIRLRFYNTDVSDVLNALVLQTHASIIFPAQLKKPITINLTASSTEEALRYIVSSANLAFRRVGSVYVVAAAADLRQALEPYYRTPVYFGLNTLTGEAAAKLITDALPYVIARPAGNMVQVLGNPDDIAQARAFITSQDRPRSTELDATQIVTLNRETAANAASIVKTLFPGLRAEPTLAEAGKSGGAVGLSGPSSLVAAAADAIHKLDERANISESDHAYRIYNIKYQTSTALVKVLEKAAPAVTTLLGPETYNPPRAELRLLSGASLGSSSSSGGSSGSSSGSSSGGSSSGGAGGSGGSGGAGLNAVQPIDRVRSLVLIGAASETDAALRLLASVDTAPPQVSVDVRVLDTSPEYLKELGVQYSYRPITIAEAKVGAAGLTGAFQGFGLGTISRLPFAVDALFNAIERHRDTKLLADPRITVIDNEDATIFIGDTIRAQIAVSSLASSSVNIVEFPVGIVLLVRPHVNEDGQITMRVHPVVSTVTNVIDGNIPQTSTREAETTVRVKDGDTVVIGGLIRDEDSKTLQEVPFLSKLPIIGQLFRNRSVSHRHSEIIVFITPRIVK